MITLLVAAPQTMRSLYERRGFWQSLSSLTRLFLIYLFEPTHAQDSSQRPRADNWYQRLSLLPNRNSTSASTGPLARRKETGALTKIRNTAKHWLGGLRVSHLFEIA